MAGVVVVVIEASQADNDNERPWDFQCAALDAAGEGGTASEGRDITPSLGPRDLSMARPDRVARDWLGAGKTRLGMTGLRPPGEPACLALHLFDDGIDTDVTIGAEVLLELERLEE